VGSVVGDTVGEAVGSGVGWFLLYVGSCVGWSVGEGVLIDDGSGVGLNALYVGSSVGSTVGESVGAAVGEGVGTRSSYVGEAVGEGVGATVGESVGRGVGAATVVTMPSIFTAVSVAGHFIVTTMISAPVTGSFLMAVILLTMFKSLSEMPGASTTLLSRAVLTSVNSAVVEPAVKVTLTPSLMPAIWYVG